MIVYGIIYILLGVYAPFEFCFYRRYCFLNWLLTSVVSPIHFGKLFFLFPYLVFVGYLKNEQPLLLTVPQVPLQTLLTTNMLRLLFLA